MLFRKVVQSFQFAWLGLGLLVFALATPSPVAAYGIEDLKADLDYLRTQNVIASLLFVPFGSNPDPNFAKHRLSDKQIQDLCANDCASVNMGANFGTIYKAGNYGKARDNGMNWTLEIAQSSTKPEDIASVINNEGIGNVIIRIGIGGDSYGFNDPGVYANYLRSVSAAAGGATFYAIAGPNEPDIEHWFAPSCPDPSPGDGAYYDCVGRALANYMNAVIAAGLPGNIRLLSPAFNLTSFTSNDAGNSIPQAMQRAGANFGGLYAIAGNIYPNGDTMQNIWNNGVGGIIAGLGKPLIITETGPWESQFIGDDPNSPYDLSLYDEYDADDGEFYLHPIRRVMSENNAGDVPIIRNDLINQGYQAYCATPRYIIESQLGPLNIVEKYLNLYGPTTLAFDSRQELDYSEAETPLWRDVGWKRYLFASIEEFFGYKDTKVQDVSQAELRSAPVNSLLTEDQRCQQSIKMLSDVNDFCQRLENPDNCALFDQEIPDTNFTFKTLFDEVRALPPGPPETNSSMCTHWEELLGKNDARLNEVIEALAITPLYLDRAYRTAFLVVAVNQVNKQPGRFMTFFSPDDQWRNPHNYEVFAVPFKVPDFGTNPGTDSGATALGAQLNSSSYLDWSDALDLTRDSLLTKQQQENNQEEQENFIDQLRTSAEVAAPQPDGVLINCAAGTPDPCDAGEVAGNTLTRALVDIINGQGMSPELATKMLCGQPTTEDSKDIKDDATINPDPTNQVAFVNSAGQDFGPQLISHILPPDLGEEVKYRSIYEIDRSNFQSGYETNIDFYLVYPSGINLEAVEGALSGAFFNQHELNSLNYGDSYKRQGFEMQSTIQDFVAGSESREFTDPTDCTIQLDPLGLPRTVCKEKSFTGGLGEPDEDPARIPGGGLGYWMRIIQLNLSKLVSAPRRYLASCKTTEEFLTGRCSGEDVSPKYWPLNPRSPVLGDYCNVLYDELTVDSGNYDICLTSDIGGQCQAPVARQSSDYFVDPNSTLKIKLKTSFIDGATLLLTNTLSPNNPAQYLSNRCEHGGGTNIEIWHLPLTFSGDLGNYDQWRNNSSKLKYRPIADGTSPAENWTNTRVELPVKPGHYKVFVYATGCGSGVTSYLDATGSPITTQRMPEYFTLTNTALGESQFCADVIWNSNMPGQDEVLNSIPHCNEPLSAPYNTALHKDCGGLHGSTDGAGRGRWESAAQAAPGRDLYQTLFHRPFLPLRDESGDGEIKCGDLFPNVVAKVGCSSI